MLHSEHKSNVNTIVRINAAVKVIYTQKRPKQIIAPSNSLQQSRHEILFSCGPTCPLVWDGVGRTWQEGDEKWFQNDKANQRHFECIFSGLKYEFLTKIISPLNISSILRHAIFIKQQHWYYKACQY